MATVATSKKACSVNPLKMSQPIGAALAFMGLNNCMPVLHGSQGCTAFGLVLFVRHFREAIPLQTTAMNEVTTIMGGMENIEQALININTKAKPDIIGIASTGLTETKGDDVDGYLKLIHARHPELAKIPVVYISTPDYKDAFQDGWARAVTKMIEELVPTGPYPIKDDTRINVLPGSHITPGDLDELRDIFDAFGLTPVFLPDLSGSLDGHIPEDFSPTTLGGTTLADIRVMGGARLTIAIGEQMRPAADAMQSKTGVPSVVFDRLTGLEVNDRFIGMLAGISGRAVPNKFRRERSQLVDAMLDGHFSFGRKRIAIGAEPDLLWSLGSWLTEMGCTLTAAVTTTHSPMLEKLAVDEVLIGDLEDLEQRAQGCDLLLTHSHGRQMAQRLDIPFVRIGLPLFDRLGAAHRRMVGYRATRDLIFEIGNLFIANGHELTAPTQDATTHIGTVATHGAATVTFN